MMGLHGHSKLKGKELAGDELAATRTSHGGSHRRSDRGTGLEGSFVKVHCESSMSKVCRVFSAFSEEKRTIIKAMGFGGLLNIPNGIEADPQFSLWLMRNLETTNSAGLCLRTRNVLGLPIRDIDVHMILGIPCEGDEVLISDSVVSENVVRVVRKILLLGFLKQPITIDEVEEILVKDYGRRMSFGQHESFKVAAVIFAMTHFLAPKVIAPNTINTEVLRSLVNPDEIGNKNWAGYVLNNLKKSANRVRYQVSLGAPSVTLHGCPLMLEVFYLDNMDFGEQRRQHDVFPRIMDYDCEYLHRVIAADTKENYMSRLDVYGITKPLPKTAVCYSRGFTSRTTCSETKRTLSEMSDCKTQDDLTYSNMQEFTKFGLQLIDEHANTCYDALRLVSEAKAMLQNSVIEMRSKWISFSTAKAESRKRKDRGTLAEELRTTEQAKQTEADDSGTKSATSGNTITGREQDVRIETRSMVEIDGNKGSRGVVNFEEGSSSLLRKRSQDGNAYSESIQKMMPETYGTEQSMAENMTLNMGQSVTQDAPLYDVTPVPSAKGLETKTSKELCLTDENVDNTNEREGDMDIMQRAHVSINAGKKIVQSHSVFGVSPFVLGLRHRTTPSAICKGLIKKLDSVNAMETNRNWYHHHTPSELIIDGSNLIAMFRRQGSFSVPLVDALTRLFLTLNRNMYAIAANGEKVWTHYMPASFATSVMNAENYLGCPQIREMFIGEHLGYDVENCRMIVVPVVKKCRWSIYVWDFLERSISVLDPCLQHNYVSLLEWEHDDTMEAIHDALFDCKEEFFNGWDVNRFEWDFKHLVTLGGRCRSYNSGVYAMQYARFFDGSDVTDTTVEDDIVMVRADMLYQLLTMPGNEGELPTFLTELQGL